MEFVWPRSSHEYAPYTVYGGIVWVMYNAALTATLVVGVIRTPKIMDRIIAAVIGLALSAQVLHMYFTELYTLMDRSIAFIGAGILLLGSAVMMEWMRRHAGKQGDMP